MPTETNEDVNIDELLAELKNETSEVSTPSKKEEKPEFKHEKPEWVDKKNDEHNEYEYQDTVNETDKADEDW